MSDRSSRRLPSACDHDVGGFQVAMQDAAGVRLFECARDLDRQVHRLRRRTRPPQRLPIDVFQHEIIAADVEDLADMRMIQSGNRARLLLEPVAVVVL
jgi:hypothetical protein